MIRKKLIIFLSIVFISSNIHAKIGDTYSCQMTEYWSTEMWWTGKVEKKPLETFSFKREIDSWGNDSIVITPGFYPGSLNFSDGYFEVTDYDGEENFTAEGFRVYMTYDNQHDDIDEIGWFNWVLLYPRGIESVLAMCKIDISI